MTDFLYRRVSFCAETTYGFTGGVGAAGVVGDGAAGGAGTDSVTAPVVPLYIMTNTRRNVLPINAL